MENCYCGAATPFIECCARYIKGTQTAKTALDLMRSRYTAYAIRDVDYLLCTTHSSTRNLQSRASILEWATSNQWIKLQIIENTADTVEFKAFYLNKALHMEVHHEFSRFKWENQEWYYVDGE